MGPGRTPTVHWGPYDGRPWVAQQHHAKRDNFASTTSFFNMVAEHDATHAHHNSLVTRRETNPRTGGRRPKNRHDHSSFQSCRTGLLTTTMRADTRPTRFLSLLQRIPRPSRRTPPEPTRTTSSIQRQQRPSSVHTSQRPVQRTEQHRHNGRGRQRLTPVDDHTDSEQVLMWL